MADQKTSALDEITEFAAGDLLYVARPGSDEQKKITAANAIPSYQIDPNPVILDFENDVFSWGGEDRDLSDLTDNGSGSYTLPYVDWWQHEHTIVIEAEVDTEAGSWSGNVINFESDNSSDEQVNVNPQLSDNRLEFRAANGTPSNSRAAGYISTDDWGNRNRLAFIHKPNVLVDVFRGSGSSIATSTHLGTAALKPTEITINTLPEGWTVHRIAFYPKALEGAELYSAMNYANDVHVLGDSFVVFLGTKFARALDAEIILEDADITPRVSYDGVGGVAFYEPDGDGHTQRFALTPAHWNKTLVLNDGGFESSRGEVIVQWSIAQVLQYLTHVDDAKRYVFLQPNPINAIGSGSRTTHDETMGLVRTLVGEHFVEMLESMFCAYDPNEAQDLTDIGNGIWPDSLRVDSTHYTLTGQAIYAHACHGAMVELGYIAGAEGVPGVVQNLIDTAGTITWDAPADDGGHPIMGYLIEKDDSGAWNNQTAQGSPTGYTKQYIRSWDAPEADTYRVSAINRAGAGATTEVVVS